MKYFEKHPPYIGRAKAFDRGHLSGQAGHCLLYGENTAGAHSLSVARLKKGSEAPLHVHTREDETFYLISGRLDARVGERHFELEPGDSIFLPRGLPHRLLCLSDEAEVLMLVHPPGLDRFFDQMARAATDGPPPKERLQELAREYGVSILGD